MRCRSKLDRGAWLCRQKECTDADPFKPLHFNSHSSLELRLKVRKTRGRAPLHRLFTSDASCTASGLTTLLWTGGGAKLGRALDF